MGARRVVKSEVLVMIAFNREDHCLVIQYSFLQCGVGLLLHRQDVMKFDIKQDDKNHFS
jgi:hypothetical protein